VYRTQGQVVAGVCRSPRACPGQAQGEEGRAPGAPWEGQGAQWGVGPGWHFHRLRETGCPAPAPLQAPSAQELMRWGPLLVHQRCTLRSTTFRACSASVRGASGRYC